MALGLKPLRSRGPAELLDPIEQELGGKVFMRDGRFYLDYPADDMEVTMIAYLLINGSLSDDGYLLWDEPEANLNPKRARLTSDTAAGLAHAGAQVFIATHDYALTSELSLKVDTGALRPGDAAFFALRRDGHDVLVERGQRLAELQHNAILDAIASLHEREQQALFAPGEPPR
ncbi:hypothetical protein WMF31_31600 [Sorangium sp. So ce1036]|uniref:hypothetical protein n=1 Tax=Sorangium sp. So ce1036 TaxID=3133328 RepID=UPI003F036E65